MKYYNCPIKTAYMAKYYGMRFQSEINGKEYPLEILTLLDPSESPKNFYIHPDSDHLLTPCTEDLCVPWKGKIKIIQRDGLAFMWPENVEEETVNEFGGATSAELFQELGKPKEEAESMERGLHAVMRRNDMRDIKNKPE